jgi:hypothetical protein
LNTLSTISTSISNYNSDLVNSTTWEPSVAGLFLINYKALIGSGDANYLVESTIQIEKETTEGWNVINNSKIRNWGSNVNVADARVFIMSHTLPFTIYAVVGDKFRFSFFGRSYNSNDICMLTSSVNSNITITKFNNVSTLVSVTDNEDEDNVITFVPGGDGSGNVGLEYDDNFKYNPSTGTLTVSNISGTLMTANQSNITSVGILNSVDIDGGTIDGTTIGANIASSGSFTTLSSSGNITGGANSILSVASGTDTTHTLGNAKIGYVGHTDCATFSHSSNAIAGNYALLQGPLGITNVNAKTGQFVALCINNVPVLRVYSTDVYLVQPLKINNTKLTSVTSGTTTTTEFTNNQISGTNGSVFKIESMNANGKWIGMSCQNKHFLFSYNNVLSLQADNLTVNGVISGSQILTNADPASYFGYSSAGTDTNWRIIVSNTGYTVGGQYASLACSGFVVASNIGFPSDDNLKSSTQDITNGLSLVRQLNPKKYNKHPYLYTADENPDLSGVYNYVEMGLIAQEVEKIEYLKHTVGEIPNKLKDGSFDEVNKTHKIVDYTGFIPVCLAGLKELDQIVTTQASVISSQASIISSLEAKLSALEARMVLAGI